MEAVREIPSEIFTEEEKHYVKLSYEDIKKISDELIEKHKQVYIALANAESIEDGEKYFDTVQD